MDSSTFISCLYGWYHKNQRVLPWRETQNPYYIWLSEIIMQQTKIAQGLPYYNTFVEKFPTVSELANVTEDMVLATWQGLGYYSRARNLHHAAKYILSHHLGVFPEKYEEVISLKGVGEYTAAAIMSFAYNMPYAAIDGNVYRVLSRIFGITEAIDTSQGKKTFEKLAQELLDKKEPRIFNNAMMDFGALQCTPKQADCPVCPFVDVCVACSSGLVSQLPIKKNKVKVRERYFYYFDIRFEDFLFLKKRAENDIWQGLFDLLLFEKNEKLEDSIILREFEDFLIRENLLINGICVQKVYRVTHILTHQKINVVVFNVKIDSVLLDIPDFEKVNVDDVYTYPMSTLLKNYLQS